MGDEKQWEPRLVPAEREVPGSVDQYEGETDAGHYIAQLASAWAAVRKKSIENS